MSKIENNRLAEFRKKREEANEKIFDLDHLGIKRFFNLDTNTYKMAPYPLRLKNCLDW